MTASFQNVEQDRNINEISENQNSEESDTFESPNNYKKSNIINVDEDSNSSQIYGQPQTELDIEFSQELSIVLCLAAYSKISVLENEMFAQKLDRLFVKGAIYGDNEKQRIVEKYVVSAIVTCEKKVSLMVDDLKRKLLTDIYHDKLPISQMKSYIVFDDNIIEAGNIYFTATEM